MRPLSSARAVVVLQQPRESIAMSIFCAIVSYSIISCLLKHVHVHSTTTADDVHRSRPRPSVVNLTDPAVFVWKTYSDWNCNVPTLSSTFSPRVTTFVNSKNYAIPRQRALLLTTFEKRVSETWIFDKKADSWDKLDVPAPPHRPGCLYSLVTLCNTTVLMVRMAHAPRRLTLPPDIWRLGSETTGWKKVKNDRRFGHSLVIPKRGDLNTLPVSLYNSTSKCNESVLVMAANSTVLSFWQLTLRVDKRTVTWTDLEQRCHVGICPFDVFIMSAGVQRTSGLVYYIAQNGLFTYSMSSGLWTLVTSWQSGNRNNNGYFQCRSRHCFGYVVGDFYISVSPITIWQYNTKTGKIKTTNYYGGSMSLVFVGKQLPIIAHFNTFKQCGPILFETRTISWGPFSYPELAPVASRPSSVALSGSRLYTLTFSPSVTLVKKHPYSHFEPNGYFSLWLLNLDAMKWLRLESMVHERQIYYHYVTGSILDGRVYVALFTGHTSAPDALANYYSMDLHVLGFVLEGRRWIQYQVTTKPSGRQGHSVVVLDETSILIFGGYREIVWFRSNDNFAFNDTWILTIPDASNSINTTAVWSQIVSKDTTSPGSRYGHSMVRVGSIVVLYGGRDESGACLNDFWHFNIENRTWIRPLYRDNDGTGRYGPRLSSNSNCFSTATAIGRQMFVLIPCRNVACLHLPIGLQLWMYLPSRVVWVFTSVAPGSKSSSSYSIFLWKDQITVLDTKIPSLVFSHLGCPAGYASVSMSSLETPCDPCLVGWYSRAGATACTRCPDGLYTKAPASTSVHQCDECRLQCAYGVCQVDQSSSQPLPTCKCTIGFTGGRCQHPTYYLVTLGIILFLVVLATGIIIPVKIWRKRRIRERLLVGHVERLQGVWQVDDQEIVIQKRIGQGGYGDVYLAEYRDILVAVKYLRLTDEQGIIKEFENEIKFMQTVRHPNIVLFLGAGRRQDDGTPFIVVEYMSGGSFRDLLDDVQVDIPTHRKLCLCLDIANGMEFLHHLNPPRIHRDLKCDNLLISASQVGKIADFGLGIQIGVDSSDGASDHEESTLAVTHRHCVELNETYTLSMPLLRVGTDPVSHGVGATRWRAPEISRHRPNICCTATDVYR